MSRREAGYPVLKVEETVVGTSESVYDFRGSTIYIHVYDGGTLNVIPIDSTVGWMINKGEKEGHFTFDKVRMSASQDNTKVRIMYLKGV